jgi:hypothetical protein
MKPGGFLVFTEVTEDTVSRANQIKIAVDANGPICLVGEGWRGFNSIQLTEPREAAFGDDKDLFKEQDESLLL